MGERVRGREASLPWENVCVEGRRLCLGRTCAWEEGVFALGERGVVCVGAGGRRCTSTHPCSIHVYENLPHLYRVVAIALVANAVRGGDGHTVA